MNKYISNCCGTAPTGNYREMNVCPSCKEHCVYVCEECGYIKCQCHSLTPPMNETTIPEAIIKREQARILNILLEKMDEFENIKMQELHFRAYIDDHWIDTCSEGFDHARDIVKQLITTL